MVDEDDMLDAYRVLDNVHKAYWYASVAAAAHPYTRKMGLRALSYGARVHLNALRAAAGAALSTPLARGGTFTAGGFLASAAVGYGIGAVVGTGVAYAMYGEEGAENAIDLYTGQVSAGEYFDTVGSALKKTFLE